MGQSAGKETWEYAVVEAEVEVEVEVEVEFKVKKIVNFLCELWF